MNALTPAYEKIRNVSIIAHIDHGKTTLSDFLLGAGGILPSKLMGYARALDDLSEEQKRGITIESSLASMHIVIDEQTDYLLNLIDTPGHVDFSGKVAEALRLVDGSIVLVDAVEGVMAQTVTVLRQAMREYIQPILVINKIDRLITELEVSESEIQRRIQQIVVEVRNICATQKFDGLQLPAFRDGSVLLISAIDGWGVDYSLVVNHQLNMSKIINYYANDDKDTLGDIAPLSEVIIKAIYHCLPNPHDAQQLKFPNLISNRDNIKATTLQHLLATDSTMPPVILVGKFQQFGRKAIYGSLVRMVSGTIKKNSRLFSPIMKQETKVSRIVKMRGRSTVEVKELVAGEVGGVIFSPPPIPGDILTHGKSELLFGKNIGYVQEPVVAISLEPKKINEIGRLQDLLEKICDATPGLVFESDVNTGELKALGVGTLQLDILVKDIEAAGIAVETSEPIILKFEMPLQEVEFTLSKNAGVHLLAGRTSDLQLPDRFSTIYDDQNENYLHIGKNYSLSADALEGISEVFRHAMRTSPLSGERVRNTTIVFYEGDHIGHIKAYEEGIILAAAVVRESLRQVNAQVHEPFYKIELSVPEQYTGGILQELQRLRATISDMTSDGAINIIYAVISLQNSAKIANDFRQLSDGNAFWSFTEVLFKPIFSNLKHIDNST